MHQDIFVELVKSFYVSVGFLWGNQDCVASTHHMIFLIFKHIIFFYSVAIWRKKESRMVAHRHRVSYLGCWVEWMWWGAKEKTEWLRALTAPAEDLSLVPSTRGEQCKLRKLQLQEYNLLASSGSRHTQIHTQIHTHTDTHSLKKNKQENLRMYK